MKSLIFIWLVGLVFSQTEAKVTLYKCGGVANPDPQDVCDNHIPQFIVNSCDGNKCAISKGKSVSMNTTIELEEKNGTPVATLDQFSNLYFDLAFEIDIKVKRQAFPFLFLNKTLAYADCDKSNNHVSNNKNVLSCGKSIDGKLFWFQYDFFVPSLTPTGDFKMKISLSSEVQANFACCKMAGSFKD